MRSRHQHRIKVYTTQVFCSMIMRGVDLNMTLAGPGASIGLFRVGWVHGWGEWGCLSMARHTVRSIALVVTVTSGSGRSAWATFGGPIFGWCGRCPSRSRSSRRTLRCHSWLVVLPYPWSRWVEQHFQRGARRSMMCLRSWVVLVRVAGGMVASVSQPGGVLGSLPWFACPGWWVATYFGAWSRFWRPRVDRPDHGETVAREAIVFTAWRAISWRGDPAALVRCDARGLGGGVRGDRPHETIHQIMAKGALIVYLESHDVDSRTRYGSAVPPTTAEPYLNGSPQMAEWRIVLIVSRSPFPSILPWGRSRIGEARRSTSASWPPQPASHLSRANVSASRPTGRCGPRERDRPQRRSTESPEWVIYRQFHRLVWAMSTRGPCHDGRLTR